MGVAVEEGVSVLGTWLRIPVTSASNVGRFDGKADSDLRAGSTILLQVQNNWIGLLLVSRILKAIKHSIPHPLHGRLSLRTFSLGPVMVECHGAMVKNVANSVSP